jgi:hypothetical protein
VADLLVDRGELVKVHYFDGFPYTGYALAGVAELGDIVFAYDNGKIRIMRNFSARRDSPEWKHHYRDCAVRLPSAG